MTKVKEETLSNALAQQLLQLMTMTHDEDLISQHDRNALYTMDLCSVYSPWNVITKIGIKMLSDSGMLEE